MSYTILLHPKVEKQIGKMNKDLRRRIRSALSELQDSPDSIGERLPPSNSWKLRDGDYRVIYQIDRSDKSIVVLFVGHRSKI